MLAHALNPSRPISPTETLANLSETFLFWRISREDRGCLKKGRRWDTAMPAWEKFLKEEEMWDVILFLYDFTGPEASCARPGGRALMIPRHVIARRRGCHSAESPGCVQQRRDRCACRGRRPDVGTEAQRESGKILYLKYCCAVPRRERGRRRLRHAASAPPPARLHHGQVQRFARLPAERSPTHQDLVNIIRLGMPYTSMPAWPRVVRPGSVGYSPIS